ncbi:hypothetical protein BC833DRAFT_588365 [Globomyces pollinis-pini]|nr:hypothetical protein BC833DRAFT_588365 [Globomyces pollinis-pini]
MVLYLIASLITYSLAQNISTGHTVNLHWFSDNDKSPFVYFESTMVVPPVPTKEWQTLFIWPGIQPLEGKTFAPIGNGVLQPVLTWGQSCAPDPTNARIDKEKKWWISAQYVNTDSSAQDPERKGCLGGTQMSVEPDDSLVMIMELAPDNLKWIQTVKNQRTGAKVDFTIDMKGQRQGWAMFVMETPGGWHDNVPQFNVTNIVLKTSPGVIDPTFCTTKTKVQPLPGANVACSDSIASENTCRIAQCVFNARTPSPTSTSLITTTTASQTSSTTLGTSTSNVPYGPTSAVQPSGYATDVPISSSPAFGMNPVVFLLMFSIFI